MNLKPDSKKVIGLKWLFVNFLIAFFKVLFFLVKGLGKILNYEYLVSSSDCGRFKSS